MLLPPDRSHLATEQQHEETHSLDLLSTLRLRIVIKQKIKSNAITAVQDASEFIASFIDALNTSCAKRWSTHLYWMRDFWAGSEFLMLQSVHLHFNLDPEQIIGLIAGGDASLTNII